MIRRLAAHEIARLAWVDRLQSPTFHWDAKGVAELFPSHEFWVLEDAALGFPAWLAIARLPDAWEITALATHPDGQRRGWMRQLLQKVIDAKLQEAEIWLEVHEGNHAAQALYKTLGFQEVGRRPRYYSDGAAALLLTRK